MSPRAERARAALRAFATALGRACGQAAGAFMAAAGDIVKAGMAGGAPAARAAFRAGLAQPSRRPVLVSLVVVPALGLAGLLFLPRDTAAQAAPSPAASPSPSVAAPPEPKPPPIRPNAFEERNPFRVRKNRIAEATPPPVANTPPPPPPPPPPPLDASTKLDLVGTFVMGKDRYAVIVVKQKNQEVVVKEDESPLPNSRVIKIAPREVRLLMDGQEAVLRLDFIARGQGGPVGIAAPPPPANPYGAAVPPPADLPVLPPGVDGQARRLARNEVDQYLDNLNQLLTQVNIQPVFQAGQPSGFRLTDIQRGTILDQIGIQDGDTLRFVNGQRIDSVQSAFQLYNILKESTNVEITVIRNTRPVTLRYLIY